MASVTGSNAVLKRLLYISQIYFEGIFDAN
jgi:hypothetical protein